MAKQSDSSTITLQLFFVQVKIENSKYMHYKITVIMMDPQIYQLSALLYSQNIQNFLCVKKIKYSHTTWEFNLSGSPISLALFQSLVPWFQQAVMIQQSWQVCYLHSLFIAHSTLSSIRLCFKVEHNHALLNENHPHSFNVF